MILYTDSRYYSYEGTLDSEKLLLFVAADYRHSTTQGPLSEKMKATLQPLGIIETNHEKHVSYVTYSGFATFILSVITLMWFWNKFSALTAQRRRN